MKRIFVVGCPRSGTTLLQNLLLNIEGSYSFPETNFFGVLPDNFYAAPSSLPPFFEFSYPSKVSKRTLSRILKNLKKAARLELSPEKEKELYKRAEEKDLAPAELFDELMASYNDSGRSIMIEKTPGHIFHVSYIKEIFPDAAIINIVRDPRDTFVSFLKLLSLSGKKERSIAEFCRIWNGAVESGFKNNLITVRYEDLVSLPLKALNSALEKFGFKVEVVDANNYDKIVLQKETWKAKNKGEVLKNNFNQFENSLSAEQIARIESLCAENMKKYGYENFSGAKRSFFFDLKDSFRWLFRKNRMLLRIIYENCK